MMLDFLKEQKRFLLENQINVIDHINILKEKNIKSCWLMQKNAFDTFQAPIQTYL